MTVILTWWSVIENFTVMKIWGRRSRNRNWKEELERRERQHFERKRKVEILLRTTTVSYAILKATEILFKMVESFFINCATNPSSRSERNISIKEDTFTACSEESLNRVIRVHTIVAWVRISYPYSLHTFVTFFTRICIARTLLVVRDDMLIIRNLNSCLRTLEFKGKKICVTR